MDGPCVVQYPKDGIVPYAQNVTGEPFAVGKWQTLIPGGQDAVILAYGRMTLNAIQASELLVKCGLSVGVIDCCSLKPMDMDCLRALFARGAKLITVEEGEMIGGFGSEIARVCVEENADAPIQIIGLENRFITHGSVPELLELKESWTTRRKVMSDKKRVDVALVERGLAQSREKAQALVMSGVVYIGENKVDKASAQVTPEDELIVRQTGTGYVSRGALKLEKGLAVFGVEAKDRVAMDLGASTGGFTDVLLQNGAAHVYAIDVGYGQLDWKLRNDPRVTVMERTNARYLTADDLPLRPTLGVMDVSFISITKILPAAAAIMGENGEFISLIKPQFEAGRDRVGKKGVVRDAQVHLDVVKEILHFIDADMGWTAQNLSFSPIKGPEGNIEFLVHILPKERATHSVTEQEAAEVVRQAHESLGNA